MREPKDKEALRIHRAYAGVFTRIERATEDERAYVLWCLLSHWCAGCGKPIGECIDDHDEDPDRCCDVPTEAVTAKKCPKCDMIPWSTVEVVEETESRET